MVPPPNEGLHAPNSARLRDTNMSPIGLAARLGRCMVSIVACCCLLGCWSMVPKGAGMDAFRHAMQGEGLSAEEAQALEDRLQDDPGDEVARATLIGYYLQQSWGDAAKARSHGRHVAWLVRNAPRSPLLMMRYGSIDPERNPEGYARVKEIWMEHLEAAPRDTGLLGNAAAFLDRGPDLELAVSFLERAQEIDPGNARWASSLGDLRLRMAQRGQEPPDQAVASEALSNFERAGELGYGSYGMPRLTSAMHAAFVAGRFDKARAYAAEALAGGGAFWNLEPEYRANLMLGRIALAEDDPEAAGKYLVAAGRLAAWPSLTPLFAIPDMQLASELLERGEREVVLKYLKLCALHWEDDRLDQWGDDVRAGRIPDFGRNFSYY